MVDELKYRSDGGATCCQVWREGMEWNPNSVAKRPMG